jgi:hypothetical protein
MTRSQTQHRHGQRQRSSTHVDTSGSVGECHVCTTAPVERRRSDLSPHMSHSCSLLNSEHLPRAGSLGDFRLRAVVLDHTGSRITLSIRGVAELHRLAVARLGIP